MTRSRSQVVEGMTTYKFKTEKGVTYLFKTNWHDEITFLRAGQRNGSKLSKSDLARTIAESELEVCPIGTGTNKLTSQTEMVH